MCDIGNYKKLCGREDCDYCFKRSFANTKNAKFWSEKNTDSPRNFTRSTDKKVWLFCPVCNHESFVSCNSIEKRDNFCAYCVSYKLCEDGACRFCFDKSFASCASSKYWSSKNSASPRSVAKTTEKKYLFFCPTCKHEKMRRPCVVERKEGSCSFCFYSDLCDEKDCKFCFEKSFASTHLAECWSDKNSVSPRKVRKTSNKKYYLECSACKHMSFSSLSNVSRRGTFCGYCYGQRACESSECDFCTSGFFSSHHLSRNWSSKNPVPPSKVRKTSQEKFLFDCKKCGHEFRSHVSGLSKITPESECIGCPYCRGRKRCKKEKSCLFCVENSFEKHPNAVYWSKNNKFESCEASLCSRKKALFDCPECGLEFETKIINVAKGSFCPYCVNKTETKVLRWLDDIFYSVVFQPRFDWCKNPKTGKYLPFDFCVSDELIIEVDGIQHFEQVSNWMPPEEQQKRDRYKEERAAENGYKVLRLGQEDVWYDRIDWKQKILDFFLIDD